MNIFRRKNREENEAPGLYSMWKYEVILNNKARKIVLDRFFDKLLLVCREEDIKVTIFETEEELNKNSLKSSDSNVKSSTAVGLYGSARKALTNVFVYNEKFPYIYLNREDTIVAMTLAHELGHHFCMKEYDDTSEEGANAYIRVLAEKYLTPLEKYILRININVCSGKDIPYPRITKKDWKLFKKEFNIC